MSPVSWMNTIIIAQGVITAVIAIFISRKTESVIETDKTEK